MLPPAIALFSALLKERGHKVDLFDSTDYPNPEEDGINSDKRKEENLNARPYDDTKLTVSFKEENVFEAFKNKVNNFSPDLLAMSTTEDMFHLGVELLKKVETKKIQTLLGGVFPTFAPDLVLSYSQVDMVCVGEGEKVIVRLCERMENGHSYKDIPGLWVKDKNGKIFKNQMEGAIDINSNPTLDLTIFNDGRLYRPMQGKVRKMFPLETHRGCPYKCAFCNSPSQWDLYKSETSTMFFRKKSPEKIREEIINFKENYNVEAFYFWADTFFAYSPNEFDAFIEMYSEFKIPFWCQTRPETVTKKRVEQLMEIGLFRMAFGVEHGNAEFRKKYIKRDMKNKLIINALQTMDKIGLPYSVNNILGLPYETRELTFDTIELNRNFFPDSANAYTFSPFHGTPLRKLAEESGFIDKNTIARSLTRPTLLNMPQYTPEQIEGMRRSFILYVKLPKNRWSEVEKAEKFTPEGDEVWKSLRDEVESEYLLHQWKNNYKTDIEESKFEELAMGIT